MKTRQSPPLLRLILFGIVVVALPLVGAIITAIVQVNQLAEENRIALMSVQKNTATSGLLVDRVTEMERTARQYQALGDDVYKILYNKHRYEMLALFEQLNQSNQDATLKKHIERVMQSELATHNMVEQVSDINDTELETEFTVLRTGIVEIVQKYNIIAKQMSNAVPQDANRLQRLLISQAALVIPVSAALALLFVVLISRPLRQINRGIRSLGHGSLSEPVSVSGTGDLKELGRQLELLRIRLIELETQKVQFLRNVSHELKTPLTNIREGAELLLHTKHKAIDAEQTTIARILRDNSIRLQRMIEELLRFGADGDISTPQMEKSLPFDQIVDDTVEKHALALSAKSIQLQTTLAQVTVNGDRKRLSIILDNLLSNAIKYTPPHGHIAIELQQNGNDVFLDMYDSGAGVSDSAKPYLFEWFFTGPRPSESIMVGTGMGLAIAQEYAQQHNGKISLIESPKGAHFRLTLRRKSEGENYAAA